MRSNYPVVAKELVNELNELQEHLINLLGYDQYAYDNEITVSGLYDTIDSVMTVSGVAMMDMRLYPTDTSAPLYGKMYEADRRFSLNRSTNG